jgi:hypothetical protein
VAIQREIINGLTEETGIEVEFTPVAEDELWGGGSMISQRLQMS